MSEMLNTISSFQQNFSVLVLLKPVQSELAWRRSEVTLWCLQGEEDHC